MNDKAQKGLNEQLMIAAEKGNATDVTALLEAGAHVNGDDLNGDGGSGLPLIWAAYNGHLAVVKILLDAGANVTLYRDCSRPAAGYARERGHSDIAQMIETPRPKRVETPDEIIFHRPLGDRTLQEAFNFVTRERISMIRKSQFGDVEAMSRENFSAIEDETMLRKAFDEHVRRGGTADEQEIFPRRLAGKARLIVK